jgi:N-methylhydantoinase A/oxoprolinase/acetone carboxylase beta subunit
MWIADGWQRDAPVFDLAAMRQGVSIEGPAAIASPFTTVILHPGDVASTTSGGDILIALGA